MLSPADLLAFCNKVRESGGAETLNELLPGYLGSAQSCLIARNLNFKCAVAPMGTPDTWRMYSKDVRINDVARALGIDTKVYLSDGGEVQWSFVLPRDVARSAKAFDMRQYSPQLYEGSKS